jgi:hypothetical protein
MAFRFVQIGIFSKESFALDFIGNLTSTHISLFFQNYLLSYGGVKQTLVHMIFPIVEIKQALTCKIFLVNIVFTEQVYLSWGPLAILTNLGCFPRTTTTQCTQRRAV